MARAASPAALLRFAKEARVLASLDHPGLCSVFEAASAGETAGHLAQLVRGYSQLGHPSEALKEAVAASKDGKPVELTVRSPQLTKTVKLDYAGGHRYPRLERIAGKPAYIDDILAAK